TRSLMTTRTPTLNATVLDPSSCVETRVRCPSERPTRGSGRAFAQRPTICAFSWPPSTEGSSHDGYSRSGAFSVRFQRPRNAFSEADALVAAFALVAWEYAAHNIIIYIAAGSRICRIFVNDVLSHD